MVAAQNTPNYHQITSNLSVDGCRGCVGTELMLDPPLFHWYQEFLTRNHGVSSGLSMARGPLMDREGIACQKAQPFFKTPSATGWLLLTRHCSGCHPNLEKSSVVMVVLEARPDQNHYSEPNKALLNRRGRPVNTFSSTLPEHLREFNDEVT